MPDNIPSLGELIYKAQPEIGGGLPGVVIDNTNTVRAITEMANVRAQNDWNKYLVFQDNLKDVYKNLSDISGLDVATEDRDYLKKKMGEVFSEIAENPRDFFSGGSKYAEIQGKISELRSDATESKLNKVYDFAHRQFLTQNPELNTPENQTKINSYLSQPLGKRQAYILDMPTLFDFPSYMKEAMTQSASPFAKIGLLNDQTGEFEGEKFISTGATYDRDKFLKVWDAGLDVQQDKYGHSIRGYAKQQYDRLLTPEQKKEMSVDEFWHKMGETAFSSGQDITDVTKIDENKAYFDEQKLGLEAQRTAAMVAAAKALAAQRYASAAKSKAQTKALEETLNPPEVFNEAFQGKIISKLDNNNHVVQVVRAQDMTKQFRDVLGIDPSSDGTYKFLPSNITLGGKQMDEATANNLYMKWLQTDQAKKIREQNGGVTPTIFDALYASGADFKIEAEGTVAPIYKVEKVPKYDENGNVVGQDFKKVLQNPDQAGKTIRSDRLQSWYNQRKQLGVKGDKLMVVGGDDESETEIDTGDNSDNQ